MHRRMRRPKKRERISTFVGPKITIRQLLSHLTLNIINILVLLKLYVFVENKLCRFYVFIARHDHFCYEAETNDKKMYKLCI